MKANEKAPLFALAFGIAVKGRALFKFCFMYPRNKNLNDNDMGIDEHDNCFPWQMLLIIGVSIMAVSLFRLLSLS